MTTRDVVVENAHGLHLRVAAEIVRLARQYGVEVRLTHGPDRSADGRSVIQLLMLEAAPGATLRVEAEGAQAGEAVERISDLFGDGGGI